MFLVYSKQKEDWDIEDDVPEAFYFSDLYLCKFHLPTFIQPIMLIQQLNARVQTVRYLVVT